MVADALSRLNVADCGISSKVYHKEDLFKGLEQAYKKEKETKRILEGLDDQQDFQVVQNKIYYTRNGRMQLYLPVGKFRDLIMQECHDTRHVGHLGVRKTADLILRDSTGQRFKLMWQHTWQRVRSAKGTSLQIYDQLDCCNLWRYLDIVGRGSVWIS